jgi:4-amino-4-deoxy-L-arabinose transferase-like glycosyltransferase
MMTRSTRLIAVTMLIAVTAALYLHDLGSAPVHISTDEARFAIQANAIATTGRDLQGNRLPLFFLITDPLIEHHSSVAWWQPEYFYLQAATFRVVPMSEWSARLPMACLAILNVWLMFMVARRWFASDVYGLIAAILLAATPAHFILGRRASDYFCPTTFALLWLWGLRICLDQGTVHLRHGFGGQVRIAAATGLALGVGLYSYITSWIVMPIYLVTTIVAFWIARKPARLSLALVAGFSIPVLPAMAWLALSNAAMPAQIVQNYKVSTSLRIAERISLYWDYFNPSFLFFSGGSNLMWATRLAGFFLLALAVLLPAGAWAIVRRRSSLVDLLPLAGFLLAPLPIVAALPEAPEYSTARVVLSIPFGILIATGGLRWLIESAGVAGRVIAAVVLISVPLQFGSFVNDYFSDYKLRSAFWLDTMNVRAIAEAVAARTGPSGTETIYMSTDDIAEDKISRWLFHVQAQNRRDLWTRTRYLSIEGASSSDTAAGSFLVMRAANPRIANLVARDRWSVVQVIDDINGSPVATLLQRQ